MAFTGPEPKERRLYGGAKDADWTDVPHVPFDGPGRLELPKRSWHKQVTGWWDVVSRMPHCCLWEPADWLFALETAFMKQDWWSDFDAGEVVTSKSTEIRRREDILGTTVEARRKLRVRYVAPELVGAAPVKRSAVEVAKLDDRRRRVHAS